LAFIHSCLGEQEEARNNLVHITDIDSITDLRGWGKYHKYLFVALTYKILGRIDKAFNFNQKAIELAEISNYTLIKAKALTGLGELYRLQGEYLKAIDEYHLKSIEILDKIGAKCDLAEAYFQLALTYQAIGDQPNSQTYFNKALDLWGPKQIDAPKQIERVKTAMKTNP
jgi:tetratricopeptide (TPR) repeat protein